jgi:hypothetical protein
MTEPTKLDRKGCLTLIGMAVVPGLILSMCSLARESGISRTQKEKYDACLAVKSKSVGLMKADMACDYLKRS